MTISKDIIMQKVQRFGGAMFTPVLMFGVFGIFVAVSILCTNPMILGPIAEKGTLWYSFWYIIQEGAWTVFRQMPLLFAIGLPIGLARKNNARACMESFLIYIIFNYFMSAMLSLYGPSFGVDFSQNAVAGSGLTLVANIKTLDTGIIGAILIAALSVWLHGKFFDVNLPESLGIFRGSSLVVIAGFWLMFPIALLFCIIWPQFQAAIASLQGFLTGAGVAGVWIYTFLERILIPTGLHHFIYIPFIFGPAVVDNGIQVYWLQHLQEFAASTKPLIELFPQGGFALHGMSKVFGCPGIALALYYTAKPENRKKVGALVFPAAAVAVLCGITEPLEFSFMFVAPLLYVLHAILTGISLFIAAQMHWMAGFGFSAGLVDMVLSARNPLAQNWYMLLVQGLVFSAIYYFSFSFVIKAFNLKTPGREDEAQASAAAPVVQATGGSEAENLAHAYLSVIGGKGNVSDVDACITRLRLTLKDATKVDEAAAKREIGRASCRERVSSPV